MFYSYDFYNPSTVVFGENTFTRVPEFLKRFIEERILIVTDNTLVKLGLVSRLEKVLDASGFDYVIYDQVTPEPTVAVANAVGQFARGNNIRALIAFGGGSVIDVAKTTAVLITNKGSIEDYLGVDLVTNPPAFMIAMPTTSGTGSEVTRASVLCIPEENRKTGVQSPMMIPPVAIVDPTLTYDIPQRMTAMTAIDAFSHAVESYVSQKASYLSDNYATESIKMIHRSIREVYANGRNYEARNNIALASHLAGVALANAGGGLVHCVAHAIGARYNISHGEAIAIAMATVSKFNMIGNPAKYANLARLLGMNTAGMDKVDAAHLGVEAIRRIVEDINLNLKAGDFGAKTDDIDELADVIIKDKRLLDNNVRDVTLDDVKLLLKQII
jgi:alcohol dehydrogenase class IV